MKNIFLISNILLILLFSLNTSFAQTDFPISWLTYFEKSHYLETPDYDETMRYFKMFEDSTDKAKLFSIGKSPQGRDLYCLMAGNGIDTLNLRNIKNSGKAIILIENGIHSGEIEGKDACMLLLRDILISKKKLDLLDNTILLIIPIFNVDGHERRSAYNRINQNGPKEMGWRTTAQNLNLNRDFMKADAPEMKSLLNLFSSILPDFFVDTHTTDGADYQYTITYSIETHQNMAPPLSDWIKKKFKPFVEDEVNKDGFLISPYVGFKGASPKEGITDWIAGPRFSNGYAAIQNRPGLLIETHMLKPYKDRVYSTKSLLTAVVEIVNNEYENLKQLNMQADEQAVVNYSLHKEPYPIKFKMNDEFDKFEFKGIKFEAVYSNITGSKIIKYTHKKVSYIIPYYNHSTVTQTVTAPLAYIIPPEWGSIVDIMKLHGIHFEKLAAPKTFIVEKTKFKNVQFAGKPYEGRLSVSFEYDTFKDTVTVIAGSFFIPTDQRAVGVIIHLLEPDAPDSFVKWGFFNRIFERKEYFENYSMEPIAKKLYDENESLRNEFNRLVAEDKEFKENPRKRLDFFYQKTKYYDQKYNLYPVMKVIE